MLTRVLGTYTLLAIAATTVALSQERQVSFDTSGSVMTIDAALEQRLGLFPEVPGFVEALMYRSADSSYVVEIFHMVGGTRERLRRTLSPDDGNRFRMDITRRLLARAPESLVDQTGRTGFIVGTTTLGLTYYGIAIPAALEVDDFRAALGLYMLTGATSFFVPYFATQNAQVTQAQSALGLYGGVKGIADGLFLYGALAGSDGFEKSATGPLLTGVAVGVTELAVGYSLAADMDGAQVQMLIDGGTIGNVVGLQIAYLIDFDDLRGYAALMLAGTAGGYVATNGLYHTGFYSEGDANVLSTTAFAGGFVPIGLLHLAGVDDGKALVGASLGGTLAGMYLGHAIALGHDFSASQGTLFGVGTAAMGLLGAGIGYLVSPSDGDESLRLAGGGGAIGTVAGVALMYGLLADDARHRDGGSLMRVEISPAGLAALARDRTTLPDRTTIPILSIAGRW